MQVPRIRDLAPEVKQELIRINKQKKQWYKLENAKALERDGKQLFKTNFHDYAHTAPKSINNATPLDFTNDGEATARYLEDHILQGLPGKIPDRLDPDGIYNNIINKRHTDPILNNAYNHLYDLGKYSVAKKRQIPIEDVTGSQIMYNKFHMIGRVSNFGNPINKVLKNQWVAGLANPETKYISKRVQKGRGNLYNSLIDRGLEQTDNYHAMASNMLKNKDPDRYLLGPTTEDKLPILQKHAPYDDIEHIKVQPDEYDISKGITEPYNSGQYQGFPQRANAFMAEPIPDDTVDDIVRRNNVEAFAIDKMHRNPYGTATPYEIRSRRRRANANISGAHIRPEELTPQYRL